MSQCQVADGDNSVSIRDDAIDTGLSEDLPSQAFDLFSARLPHLTRTQFGVHKSFDKGCFGPLLAQITPSAEEFRSGMREGFGDRQSLDSLSAPGRADFVAGNTPDLFSVRLEKCAIEFVAETVDEKLLEILFIGDRKGTCSKVAKEDFREPNRPQVHDRLG